MNTLMIPHPLRAILVAALLLTPPTPTIAQSSDRAAPAGILSLLPAAQTTKHSLDFNGRVQDYEAKAGTLSLLSGTGDVTAEVFYTYYTLPAEAGPNRPITFVFNGGPGAASAYLHIGALGPRILATAQNGTFLPPPQRMVNNPDTWLGMTDLVFVDPVGAGYSREAAGQDMANFWGVSQDASSMGAFVRLFLSQNDRTTSPVYLAGESYGGFRAALMAKTLQEDAGISPRGIFLISPALEFTLVRPDEFQPLHFALELPSLASVKLKSDGVTGSELEARLNEVERYAMGEYLTAITGGLESGRDATSQRVSEITGLPLELVQRNFARIPTSLFLKEFKRGSQLSAYDGTVATDDIEPNQNWSSGPDPILDRSVPVLTSAFVDYIRTELNYRTDISYRLLNREISNKWDYGLGGSRQGYAGVMGDLQTARSLNPQLNVVIVHGFTDLVTPYMTSRYLVSQLPNLPNARQIRLETIDGGHMMYFSPDGRRALKQSASQIYMSN